MKNITQTTLPLTIMLILALSACTESGNNDHGHTHDDTHSATQDMHVHSDGTTHAAHSEAMQDGHMEMPLEPISIGGMSVLLTQNHGPVNAGQEEHLIVRITENGGEVVGVRAWIGSEDRTMFYVGKGEYSLLSDAYDIHTTAPDPLPENAMWWIEIEKADGTKVVGSAKLIM